MDFFAPKLDKHHVQREKKKAKELRNSGWWKSQLAEGLCHYCEMRFEKEDLTMDHITPIARGGKTTRGNVVVCCKECNSKKKYYTPAEILLSNMNINSEEEF